MLRKTFTSLFFSSLTILPSMAQTASAPKAGDEELFRYILVVIFGVVILMLFLVVLILFQLTLVVSNKVTRKEEIPAEERTTIWQRIAGLKPISKEKDLLLKEDFDGISELDNPVPGWFNAFFYGTISFGILYLLVFHVWRTSDLQDVEYDKEMQIAEVKKEAYLKTVASNIDETSVKLSTNEQDLAKGKDVFIAQCAACHGQQAQGIVGPNLTDEYWLHGGKINDVFKTIKYGVPAKGMIAWEKQLNPLQMQQVASYILSLQGSNPPNAKEPQGDKVDTKQLSMN
ncbi:cbb3-type cytochrome c oxidase N-terminal domain-containing protein [Cytophagaceae bacterium DM2B3-1]|uniref:Cbb3-type cytochrome c oxidase N-terminal domain-containing protein n=1 Tax=Xanthocytophaga flava TaxID=3048013 RepID=A0ABT7CGN5_9BACT|nr:cbb3-type cytochrome c oxidase N-terminal domain-containing protein [Xanthocytophaga flavus]MDJ1466685.1 cbb3-type cytochrome c oxidase N-terminal domain-containing protein [Xanthocytophaga flavus]MDJ1492681.1 cbb3-type cytochrome c oxidase N-terminal domain-containing protein [Xanthocytophaga flavus]